MSRGLRAGSVSEMTRTVIKAVGGLESASADTGLSVSALSRAYSNEDDRPGGLGVKYLDQLGRIVPASAEPVARHFAMLAGGVFQPMPDQGTQQSNIHDLTKEFADVLAQHASAHSGASDDPSDFTSNEAQAALKETDELVQAAMIYRASLLSKIEQAK